MSIATLLRGNIAWPGVEEQVTPYLRKAMEAVDGEKDWSLTQVLEMLRAGHWGLYGVMAEDKLIGAGVTAVQHYGQRSVLEVVMFGADASSEVWIETLNCLKEEAKLMGCKAIQGRGRPGWARYLNATPLNLFEIEV